MQEMDQIPEIKEPKRLHFPERKQPEIDETRARRFRWAVIDRIIGDLAPKRRSRPQTEEFLDSLSPQVRSEVKRLQGLPREALKNPDILRGRRDAVSQLLKEEGLNDNDKKTLRELKEELKLQQDQVTGRRAERRERPTARPTPRVKEVQPPIEPPRVEVAPAPDVDPVAWYLDQVARARAARENVDLQRQKVSELLRTTTNDSEKRRYERLLSTTTPEEERDLADCVFIENLIKAREEITVWETDPSWSGEKREKAKLVREVIAPTVEYKESWGEAIQKKEAEVTGLQGAEFETFQKFFEEQRRAALSFKDLIVEERLDGRNVTVGQLRMPDGVDVARLDTVQNISQETRTQLQQIKEGYQIDFGTPGQALEEINVSNFPKEQAEKLVKKYFYQTMLFLEERKFPGSIISGLTETRFREFLANLDPKLRSEYGDSKWVTAWFNVFESATPPKMRDAEENKEQIETTIRLMKTIPGLAEAMNYTQALDEARYCSDRKRFIEENIQQSLNQSILPTLAQRQRIEREIHDLSIRLQEVEEIIPQFRERFENATGNEIERKRALLMAERIRRTAGLEAAFSVYGPDWGRRDEPIVKLFQYDERILVPKKYRNADKVIGTGFADLFGGRPYHFWEQPYAKGFIKKNIETILARGEEFSPEDFGLPEGYVFNPDQPSWQLPIDWARMNWKKLETDVGWEFELKGEKYEGKKIELSQLLVPFFDDLADADKLRTGFDGLLNKEVITIEDLKLLYDEKGIFHGKYLFAPIQRRIERFYASLANEHSQSIIYQYRKQTGESIFTNEAAAPKLIELVLKGAFEREHFQTYVSFIKGPDGFPKYAKLSELVEKPPTLRERALMILNLLGGDVRVDNQLVARGRDLIEAYLNKDEETGEWVNRDNYVTFEEFAAFAGLIIENGILMPAGTVDRVTLNKLGVDGERVSDVLQIIDDRAKLSPNDFRVRLKNAELNNGQIEVILRILDGLRNDGTAYLGADQQGRRLRLRDSARDRIEQILRQRVGRLAHWMDIQEHILSKGAKLHLGLDFVPGQELEENLQRYYQIIENAVPQLGHREVSVGLDENEPITESLIDGADPMFRFLHGDWFEWREYTAEQRAAGKRLLPLRLHWDPVLTLQEAWIELGPTMLDGRVQEPWRKNPTPQDWREALEQLERPEAYNQIDSRKRELLEIQFNCTQRNIFYQGLVREINNIPDEKGELVKDKYFEPTRRALVNILPGPLKFIGSVVLPKLLPPGVEAVTQISGGIAGAFLGTVAAGPGGGVLGFLAGYAAGNDWDRSSHWLPAGWGRWLLSRSWARRNTIPGTGITVGVWDWPYKAESLAQIFGDKKKQYG